MLAQYDTFWFDQGAWLFRRGLPEEATWVPSTRWSPSGAEVVVDVVRGSLVERLLDVCRQAGGPDQSRLVAFSCLPRRGAGDPTDQVRRWERKVRDTHTPGQAPCREADGSCYRLGVDLRAQVEFFWREERFAFRSCRRAAGTVTLHRAVLGPPLDDADYVRLAANRLFGESADPRHVWLVWAASRHGPRTLWSGETVIQDGTPDPVLRLILSGTVEVIDRGTRVATIEQGSIFGELEVLGVQSFHEASTKALTDVRILEIGKGEFTQIASVFPDLWRGLGFATAMKLRERTGLAKRLASPHAS